MENDKPTTVIAAVLLGCLGVLALLAAPILAEALVHRLGMIPGQAFRITAAEALGTALGPVGALFWMHRVGRRTAAVFAVAVVIIGNLISSYETSFEALVSLRFAVGLLGEGTAFALAMAVVSGTRQKDRNFAFLIAAQVTLGVLSFLMLPLPKDAGVAGVFLPFAGLALLALLAVRWIPQPAGGAGHQGVAAGTQASAAPAYIALGIMLIWCTGLGAVWIPMKLIGTAGGLEPARVGQALGLSTTLALIGALTASALGDRFGRILPVTVALVVQIVMVSLLRGQMSWMQFAATAAIFQIFWNMTGPYIMGTIALSDTTGKASLLIPTAQIGGFFLGPVIVSRFLTEGSLLAVNYVSITCIALALLLFLPTAARLKNESGMGRAH